MQRLTFSKAEKLTGEITVNELFRTGSSFLVHPLRVVWKALPSAGEGSVKMLVSVPKKKFKRAVKRNRIKRQVRETYRLQKANLNNFCLEGRLDLQLAFIWISSDQMDSEKLYRKMEVALSKAVVQIEQTIK